MKRKYLNFYLFFAKIIQRTLSFQNISYIYIDTRFSAHVEGSQIVEVDEILLEQSRSPPTGRGSHTSGCLISLLPLFQCIVTYDSAGELDIILSGLSKIIFPNGPVV